MNYNRVGLHKCDIYLGRFRLRTMLCLVARLHRSGAQQQNNIKSIMFHNRVFTWRRPTSRHPELYKG